MKEFIKKLKNKIYRLKNFRKYDLNKSHNNCKRCKWKDYCKAYKNEKGDKCGKGEIL